MLGAGRKLWHGLSYTICVSWTVALKRLDRSAVFRGAVGSLRALESLERFPGDHQPREVGLLRQDVLDRGDRLLQPLLVLFLSAQQDDVGNSTRRPAFGRECLLHVLNYLLLGVSYPNALLAASRVRDVLCDSVLL